jgi:predicted kinase
MKQLILLRGLPGAGKSTLAKAFKTWEHYEADMFFMRGNGYEFDATRLKEAHQWCQDLVWMAMKRNEPTIVVSNTFTTDEELQPYFDLAEKYDYMVVSLIVENRHGSSSIHSVPEATLDKMKNRFNIRLK